MEPALPAGDEEDDAACNPSEDESQDEVIY